MMKPLHWDQVRASFDQAMVLVKPKSSSFQIIEALFVNNSTAPPKEQSKRAILPSLKQEDRVLDPKKLQNIATLLRALNETRKEVSETLLHGNTNKLAVGFFETLVKMAPKKEVQFKFRNFNGDISKIKLHSVDIVLPNFAVNQVLNSLLISKMGFHFLLWAEARPKSMICLLLENQNFDLLAINLRNLRDDGYICNSLIGLNVRCKDIIYDRMMFDEMRERDVVSWINMIADYIQNGDVLGSFRLFHEIRTSGIEPNSMTLVVVIRAFKVKEIVDGRKRGSRLLREKVSLLFSAKFSCHSHKLATLGCLKTIAMYLKFLQENGQYIPNVIATFLDESGVLIQVMNELVIMHQRRKIFAPGIWLECPPLPPSR
ncbi:Formin-like protein 8 [Dendrobium catenatum]|uniref:Formin-like protein 8 n=1 Tax=Dendrobium catenatum TaxID=906689 RepID=A0A2I0VT76_9ASPA|nr:Formin-like protein 8 [Dendrobium catenatum]